MVCLLESISLPTGIDKIDLNLLKDRGGSLLGSEEQ